MLNDTIMDEAIIFEKYLWRSSLQFIQKKILDDNLILYYEIMKKEITYHLFNKVSNDLTYKLYNRLFKNVFKYSIILSMLEIAERKLIWV